MAAASSSCSKLVTWASEYVDCADVLHSGDIEGMIVHSLAQKLGMQLPGMSSKMNNRPGLTSIHRKC